MREPQIKAALIDELFAEGRIDSDTVIVSEMPVAALPRRADLVVANGNLLGFEIKSDGDTTSRLRGQIEAYQASFEGIIIVTAARHLNEVIECAPEPVGVFVIERMEHGTPMATMVRKPCIRRMGIEAAIRQMRADELYKLARTFDAVPTSVRDRFTLEQKVRELPSIAVRRAALQAIKCRYRGPFEKFMKARERQVATLEALQLLRRPAWNIGRPNSPPMRDPSELASDTVGLASLSLSVRPRRVV